MSTSVSILARAAVRVHHERPYDYDEKRGLWLYKQVGDDEVVQNILTNVGRVTIHTYLYGAGIQRATLGTGFNYIALTNNATPPAASDTVLTGEISGNGLSRVVGTITLPTGAGTQTTVDKTFTYTGGPTQGVQKTALFDAAAVGNMTHEIQFTQRNLNTNDTLQITFVITVT